MLYLRPATGIHAIRIVATGVWALLILTAVLSAAHPAAATPLVSGPMQEYLFLEGKKLYDRGDRVKAIEIWGNILPDNLYSPVAYILTARAYLKLGKQQSAEGVLKEFLKKFPNSPYEGLAKEILLDVQCRLAKPDALDVLAAMTARADADEKPALILRQARLERALKHYDKAGEHYRLLFMRYPATVEGLAAADELAWMVFHGKTKRPSFSEEEHRLRADLLFRKGRFDLAAYSYKLLLQQHPDSAQLKLNLGRSLYKDRKNLQAIELLKDLLKQPVSEKIKMEAIHTLSLLYWRLDREKPFEACCQELIEHGTGAVRRKAKFNLAANHFERKRLDQAESDFKDVLKMSPPRSMRAQVEWKLAWIQYLRKDYHKAAAGFRLAGKVAGGGRLHNASQYWEARSLLLSGKAPEAKAILLRLTRTSPLDYYGMAAAKQLKSIGTKVSIADEFPESFPDISLTGAMRSNRLVDTAIKLMKQDLHEFAFLNLRALPRSTRSSPPIIFLTARAAHGAGKYRDAQVILASGFSHLMHNPPRNAPKDFIEMAFPRVHSQETIRYAEKHALDPHLVWAVMRQESLYDESAVSPAGALGLMQVTPRASGLAGSKGKIPSKVIAQILEPKKNIAFGVRILAGNVRSFNGDLVPAIASYNADIRKVRQWVQRNGKMDQDEFIENIPYSETRHYVKNVLAGYRAYTYLHRKKDLAGYW